MSPLRRSFAPILAALAAATFPFAAALAGKYFEKGGVALHGYDPVAYFTENKSVRGNPD